jgi:hypothetical protein
MMSKNSLMLCSSSATKIFSLSIMVSFLISGEKDGKG